jgi:hypothetical protein
MVAVDLDVEQFGPFFGPQRSAAVDDLIREAVDVVSAQNYAEVMTNLNQSIKHPTPYYETQITRERITPDLYRVHDRDVVYGPWLEGTSERNQTTRFKGYASFRRAAATLQAKVPDLVQYALRRCVARLNGTP